MSDEDRQQAFTFAGADDTDDTEWWAAVDALAASGAAVPKGRKEKP